MVKIDLSPGVLASVVVTHKTARGDRYGLSLPREVAPQLRVGDCVAVELAIHLPTGAVERAVVRGTVSSIVARRIRIYVLARYNRVLEDAMAKRLPVYATAITTYSCAKRRKKEGGEEEVEAVAE